MKKREKHYKEKQLELLVKIPKQEHKTVFSLTKNRKYIFIDDIRSFRERKYHLAVISMRRSTDVPHVYTVYTEGPELRYTTVDSTERRITIDEYFEIRKAMEKEGFMFNKKTCQFIKKSGEIPQKIF